MAVRTHTSSRGLTRWTALVTRALTRWTALVTRGLTRWTALVAVLGVVGLVLFRRRQRGRGLASDYPSLDLAYDYVRPSYDLLSRRLDAVENRGRTVLTFASTLTFAMPLLAANLLGSGARHLGSPWFLLAIAAYAGIIVCGVMLSSGVDFLLPSPKALFEEQLDVEPDQFKVNQLAYAADDFVANTRLITRLSRTTSTAAILMLLEAAAFGMWILTGA